MPFKRFCVKGHDTWDTGRDKRNNCSVCRALSNRHKPHTKICERCGVEFKGKKEQRYCRLGCARVGYRKQFCPKGHDTFIVGRDKHRMCKECDNVRSRRANMTPAQIAAKRSIYRRFKRSPKGEAASTLRWMKRLERRISQKESLVKELEALLNG